MRTPYSPSRRRLLALMLAGASAPVLAARPLPSLAATRHLELASLHTGEALAAAYRQAGQIVGEALQGFQRVLRDHRTGEAHPMDPRLYDLLADLADLAGTEARFQVISGYRSPRSNAALASRSDGVATRSLHMQGQAIDIRLRGVDTREVAELARRLGRGGVGYYRSSDFVHVDTGRVRSWNG